MKRYKDLVIFFVRYGCSKSVRILTLYYNKLMGVIEEHERKKILDSLTLCTKQSIDEIKEIRGIEKFDDTNILIDTDDKMPDRLYYFKASCVNNDISC